MSAHVAAYAMENAKMIETEKIKIENPTIEIDISKPPSIPVPENTGYSVLSLGAGVQSSALALMFAKGIFFPMPEFAIFADTQAEPPGVYAWLEWLEKQLPFPVEKVTQGDLFIESLEPKLSKAGNLYHQHQILAFIGGDKRKKQGIVARHCTRSFKIDPIYRHVKASIPKKQEVVMVMGISWDEIQRMRDSHRPWVKNRYPLVEQRITRDMCKRWMVQEGYPEPPRSACVFCPYHNNAEWKRLKTEEPDQFQKAVDYEKKLQSLYEKFSNMDGVPYLHNSCKPLEEIDFDSNEAGQRDLFFGECEGMCGI
jgi:3'-phosphoadenosine 5'-phosphosulfate sulfotransferase (PAPS reductase)/FAD synthetase